MNEQTDYLVQYLQFPSGFLVVLDHGVVKTKMKAEKSGMKYERRKRKKIGR